MPLFVVHEELSGPGRIGFFAARNRSPEKQGSVLVGSEILFIEENANFAQAAAVSDLFRYRDIFRGFFGIDRKQNPFSGRYMPAVCTVYFHEDRFTCHILLAKFRKRFLFLKF